MPDRTFLLVNEDCGLTREHLAPGVGLPATGAKLFQLLRASLPVLGPPSAGNRTQFSVVPHH